MTKKPAKPKKKDALWEKMAKELRAAIPKLDAEGLAFLVEQSRIHLYNMQVDKLNKMKQEAYSASSKKTSGKAAKVKTNNPKSEIYGIDPTGTGYYLRSSTGGTMFSKTEMVQLIKIAHGPGSVNETGSRLYAWFIRERGDVLSTLQVKDKFDKRLGALSGFIKKNFKLK